MQDNDENGSHSRGRRYSRPEVNRAFNHFLQIRPSDQELLRSYRGALSRGGEKFARVFYDYLLAYPATAAVLEEFQRNGGRIETLVQRQLDHLIGLLSGEMDDDSARRMAHIGEVHFRHRIEPVWIMGAYLLYLAHLQTVVRTSCEIADGDRGALEDRITRLLFRDMGLMLEGYWDSSLQALDAEHLKVTDLQQQITGLLANFSIEGREVLHRLELDGANPVALTGRDEYVYGVSLSPEGARVAFHADYQIHTMNLDGTASGNVFTPGAGAEPQFVWCERQGEPLGDPAPGLVEERPDLITRGLAVDARTEELLKDMPGLLSDVVESASVEERTDPGLIREKVRLEVQRFFRKRAGRRPLVVPVVMEV